MKEKKGGKLKWIILIVIAVIILGTVFGGDSTDEDGSSSAKSDTKTEQEITYKKVSAKELSDEIIENVMLSDGDYVLIDDLQLLPKDKALEEKIAMLIEENKKQLVITSTVAPNSMEVSSTLQERLQWGLTTNMTS